MDSTSHLHNTTLSTTYALTSTIKFVQQCLLRFLENHSLLLRSIAPLLRSSATAPFTALFPYLRMIVRNCVWAHLSWLTTVHSYAWSHLYCDRAHLQTATFVHVCNQSHCPALESICAGYTNRPEAICVQFFFLIISLSSIVYLSCLFLFVYLLLLVLVSLFLFLIV